jgi:DNA transposition AAA+ family ATPase
MFVKNGGVPLAEEKTVQPVEILTFLGIEFDTIKMELRLPKEKLSEIKDRLIIILNSRKLKLREIQSVIGLLNFACQVVVPGKAFCRRLIDATCNVKKAWHRVRITKAMKKDYNCISLMIDQYWTSNEAIELFTDSAGGSDRGFGIYFNGK